MSASLHMHYFCKFCFPTCLAMFLYVSKCLEVSLHNLYMFLHVSSCVYMFLNVSIYIMSPHVFTCFCMSLHVLSCFTCFCMSLYVSTIMSPPSTSFYNVSTDLNMQIHLLHAYSLHVYPFT